MESNNSTKNYNLEYSFEIDNNNIGIYTPLETIRQKLYQELESMNESFVLPIEGFGEHKTSIKIGDNIPSEFGYNKIIKFITNLTIDHDKYPVNTTTGKEDPQKLDKRRALAMTEYLLKISFEKAIMDFIIITQLCFPGSIESAEIRLYGNGDPYPNNFNKIYNRIAQSIVEHNQLSWPPITTLSLKRTYSFLRQKDSVLPIVSNTNVERAICSFSNLFQKESNLDLELLWSMVGLESLFTKEAKSIMEQLRDKIHVLIGYPETHKKKLSNMYDYRSKFVHGSSNISSNYYGISFKNPIATNVIQEKHEIVTFAILLLISCLQKLIELEISDLKYSYFIEKNCTKDYLNISPE